MSDLHDRVLEGHCSEAIDEIRTHVLRGYAKAGMIMLASGQTARKRPLVMVGDVTDRGHAMHGHAGIDALALAPSAQQIAEGLGAMLVVVLLGQGIDWSAR